MMVPLSPCSRVWVARAAQAQRSAGERARILSSVSAELCNFHQCFWSATGGHTSNLLGYWLASKNPPPSASIGTREHEPTAIIAFAGCTVSSTHFASPPFYFRFSTSSIAS